MLGYRAGSCVIRVLRIFEVVLILVRDCSSCTAWGLEHTGSRSESSALDGLTSFSAIETLLVSYQGEARGVGTRKIRSQVDSTYYRRSR